jgi:hypothetical protein
MNSRQDRAFEGQENMVAKDRTRTVAVGVGQGRVGCSAPRRDHARAMPERALAVFARPGAKARDRGLAGPELAPARLPRNGTGV